MQRSKAIGCGTTNTGKCRVRRNQPLLNFRVAAGASQHRCINRVKLTVHLLHYREGVQQHGLNDEAVVIIEMKKLSVPIKAVAFIPTQHSTHAAFKPFFDCFFSHDMESGLNHCGEHYPVAVGRSLSGAGGLECLDDPFLASCADAPP